jgi:hypothetical protein
MNILKINNGKVELRKDNGSFIRMIGNGDATNADINDDGSDINNNSPGESGTA